MTEQVPENASQDKTEPVAELPEVIPQHVVTLILDVRVQGKTASAAMAAAENALGAVLNQSAVKVVQVSSRPA